MTADAALRTLIVDDEPLAVERLQILCAGIADITLVGSAGDGEAALRLIEALSPEVILLDIAMPGIDGIDIARALESREIRPAIIFCTAFDDHAVTAFEVAAVDYLLKPIAPERLARAIGRARANVAPGAGRSAQSKWLEDFWVPQRSEMVRIGAAEVDRIVAERDYMRLHVGSRSFLLHQTISALERRLDPAKFIRVHRSVILRRDAIAALRHDGLGAWQASLHDGAVVRIGRSYLPSVKAITGRR